ncbi:MAG: FadR/GntR family transcriptional regulator [Solirubrobacterales bacterium]
MAFQQIVKEPVYVQVAEQLREAILRGELAPGEALPTERELSESFGASRASVREALRALQAQGFVDGGGAPARTVVADELGPGTRDALVNMLRLVRVPLEDLLELRILVEAAALRRAAGQPEPDRLAEAKAAVQAMRQPGLTVERYDELDVQFHVALVRASGNEAMHLVMLAVRDAVSRHLLDALLAGTDREATFARLTGEHADILGAVEAGDGERAAELDERHIRRFYQERKPPG